MSWHLSAHRVPTCLHVCLLTAVLLCLRWFDKLFTHIAGQEQSRTLLVMELGPILFLSISVWLMRAQMTWTTTVSPRPMAWYAAVQALVVTAATLGLPWLAAGVLRLLPTAWLPGSHILDQMPDSGIEAFLPWGFIASLMPLLLLAIGAGLGLEAMVGGGAGCLGPWLAYGAVVVSQSQGHLGFMAGAPGATSDVLTTTGWILGGAIAVAGIAAHCWRLGGALGVLSVPR